MRGFGSIEAVLAAVREDARAEVEKIESEAGAAAARLREEDRRAPVTLPDANARIDAARRQARERAAEEDWADRRAILDARERWVGRVAADGLQRLLAADPATRRDDLLRLAREAIMRLAGDRVDLLVSHADTARTDAAWRAEIEAATARTVSVVPSDHVTTDGCIARTADGRLSYDNTYGARARRFESAWRQALGGLFDTATTPAPVLQATGHRGG